MSRNLSYKNWGYWILLASLSCIAIATLRPFEFKLPPDFSVQYIVDNFNFGSSIKDYWQNILLFLPWGIGLGTIAKQKKYSVGLCFLLFCLASGLLSSVVELSQFFMLPRTSNPSDIICNSLGGIIGGILFCWRQSIIQFLVAVFTRRRDLLTIRFLIIAITSYCFGVFLLIGVLATSVNLSNWNDDYYLAIGNETTGDRSWHGFINSLYISDQAFSQPEISQAFEETENFFAQKPKLSTALDFSNLQPNYFDQSQTIAKLEWQHLAKLISTLPEAQLSQNGRIFQYLGVSLGDRWLKSTDAATSLNKQLKKTGEFSLFVIVATQDIMQTGPARIVALSDGAYAQNLIVAQEKRDLIFRLRTPITGDNPNQPTFVLPDIFDDYGFHQILFTFAHKELKAYIDGIEQTYKFKFNFYNSFHSFLPWEIHNWTVNLKEFSILKYQIGFYLVFLVPLVLMLGGVVWNLEQ